MSAYFQALLYEANKNIYPTVADFQPLTAPDEWVSPIQYEQFGCKVDCYSIFHEKWTPTNKLYYVCEVNYNVSMLPGQVYGSSFYNYCYKETKTSPPVCITSKGGVNWPAGQYAYWVEGYAVSNLPVGIIYSYTTLKSLNAVNYQAGKPIYYSGGKYIFHSNLDSITSIGTPYLTEGAGTLHIPSYMTTTLPCASNANLNKVDFTNTNITTIAANTFLSCINLSTVVFSNLIVNIGANAFGNCSSLTNTLIIPNSVTSIGAGAFQDCNLLNITFEADIINPAKLVLESKSFFNNLNLGPILNFNNSVKSIGDQAFGNSKIEEVDFGTDLETLQGSIFLNCPLNTPIVLPASLINCSANFYTNNLIPYIQLLKTTPPTGTISVPHKDNIPVYVPNNSLQNYLLSGTWAAKERTLEFSEKDRTDWNPFIAPTKFFNPRFAVGTNFAGTGGTTGIINNNLHSIFYEYLPDYPNIKYVAEISKGFSGITVPLGNYIISEKPIGAPASIVTLYTGVTYIPFSNSSTLRWLIMYGDNTEVMLPEGILWLYCNDVTKLDGNYNPNLSKTLNYIVFRNLETLTTLTSFYDYKVLSGVVNFPNSLSTIPNSCFFNCTELVSDPYVTKELVSNPGLYIGGGILTLQAQCFLGCIRLAGNIILNPNASLEGAGIFRDCKNITGFLSGPACTNIPTQTFNGCVMFKQRIFSDYIKTYGAGVISGSQSYTTLIDLGAASEWSETISFSYYTGNVLKHLIIRAPAFLAPADSILKSSVGIYVPDDRTTWYRDNWPGTSQAFLPLSQLPANI